MVAIGRTAKGPLVKKLQKKLKENSDCSISVDGIYGHATEEAVRDFQKNHGLPVDGIAGPQVFTALEMNREPVAKEQRSHIFISYSHKDKYWLEQLQQHLKPLVRNKKISIWADTQLSAGARWRKEIKDALAKAKAAVLLVSKDFLASDFIAEHELPPLLEAAKKEGLAILWIAVKASLYKETEISEYHALNDPSRPLASLKGHARDIVLVEVSEKIRNASSLSNASAGSKEGS